MAKKQPSKSILDHVTAMGWRKILAAAAIALAGWLSYSMGGLEAIQSFFGSVTTTQPASAE